MKLKRLALALLLAGTFGLASCVDTPDTPTPPTPDEEVTKYTVTFDSQGGSAVNSVEVEENGKVTLPAAPTKEGYTFGGWYTDAACTTQYGNGAVTANITLYAKWTEKAPEVDGIAIATAEDFISMLTGQLEEVGEGAGLVETYTLTADIDLADVDLGEELGQTAYSFQGILDGAGHTISNLTMVRQKKQVGLFEGLYGAIIKNINFKNVSINSAPVVDEVVDTSDCRGVSLFGNYAAGGSAFLNVSIDGFKVRTNADSTKVEESAGLVVNIFDTLYVENLAITGMDVELGKNSGAVLGSMKVTTDTLKVAGTEVTEKTACVIDAKNVLLEGNITGVTNDSQALGGFIGRCDNFEDGQEINVDGFVFKGTIKGTKNNGPLIGNVKQTGTVVKVSNAYVLEGGIVAYSDGTLQGTANVFAGQFKAAEATFENCYYVDRLYDTKKIKADGSTNSLGYLDPEIAAPIKAADITEITDGFTVENGTITLCGLSIDVPTDVVVEEVAASTVTTPEVTSTIENGVINVTGEIPYWHAASASGAAGNFVAVAITAAEGVDTAASYYVAGGAVSLEKSNAITVYVPVAALAEGVTAYDPYTITVRWNNNAADQVYTVNLAADITLETAPVHGAISQDVAGLTAANPVNEGVTDSFTLDYTAGEIAYVEDGNYVTVKVAQPAWAEGLNTPIISNAALVSCENSVATVKVPVKSTGAEFTVQWSATTDAQAYKITINGATLAAPTADAPVVTTYELDAVALYTELGLTETKNLSEAATYSGFTLSPAIRIKSDSLSGNKYPTIYTEDKGYISFEVAGTGVLTITTANDNRPVYLYKIIDNAWTEAGLVGVMSDGADNKVKEKTFEGLEAGKYIIAFNGLNPTLDADGKLSVEAKVKTLKLVDTVAPAKKEVPHTFELDAVALYTELGLTETKNLSEAATYSGFTLSPAIRIKSDSLSGNKYPTIYTENKGYISFEVVGTGVLTITTANDNRPVYLYKIIDNAWTEAGLVGVMSDGADNKVKEKTFEGLEAGKYIIAFNGLNPTLDADGKLSVEAKVKTLKLVDTYAE